MSANLIRSRFAAVACKAEVTNGTDSIGGTPAANDWLGSDCSVTFDQSVTADPTLTGSLDNAPGIVGAVRPSLRLRVPLRGSGTAGTAPEWGKLMRACTFAETVTAATVGAPTAATAGTTTGATLATPFAATAQLYRGMPLLLSGNMTETVSITDYTAGRVATFGETLGVAAGATTSAQIPINVRYGPTSDESVMISTTIYLYMDGLRWRFVGCVGTVSLELNTGALSFLTFEMRGRLSADPDAVALPAASLAVSRATPPRWVAGQSQLNRTLAQVRQMTLNAGVALTNPDNPETADGFDGAVATSRAMGGSMDPLTNVTTYVGLFSNFRNGTVMPYDAIIGGTAGNRFLVTCPALRSTAHNLGDREGLASNQISFVTDSADAGWYLTQF